MGFHLDFNPRPLILQIAGSEGEGLCASLVVTVSSSVNVSFQFALSSAIF